MFNGANKLLQVNSFKTSQKFKKFQRNIESNLIFSFLFSHRFMLIKLSSTHFAWNHQIVPLKVPVFKEKTQIIFLKIFNLIILL